VQSPCNPLIEDYTEIIYMFDKGDIPSIQCNMSLRGPKSMRKLSLKNKVKITLRLAVYRQSVRLGV
jgi:hypothetical protein